MLSSWPPRSRLIFETQVLPALLTAWAVIPGIVMIALGTDARQMLWVYSGIFAIGLGFALGRHRAAERAVHTAVARLCDTGDWEDLGLVVSSLANRLPTNLGRDLQLFQELFAAILRHDQPSKLTWMQRRDLIVIVQALRGSHTKAFRMGLEAVVVSERAARPSMIIDRFLHSFEKDDARFENLMKLRENQ